MPSVTDPNFALNYGWDFRESGWKTGMDANLKKLGAIIQLSILTIQDAPPGAPSNGDRYIIGVGSGAWAGKDNQIAVRVAGVWEYYTPGTGWIAYNQNDNKVYAFNVAWDVISGGGDVDLNPTPTLDKTVSGTKITMQAGEALSFGDPCRIASTGKMVKALADEIANAWTIFLAAEDIANDDFGQFLVGPGIARNDAWTWDVGDPLFLSIAGALTQTAPSADNNVVQILGIATHANRILFKPELVQVEVTV